MDVYWIWLTEIKNIGPVTQRLLLEKFRTPFGVFYAKKENMLKIKGIGAKTADFILENKSLKKAKTILEQSKKNDIKFLKYTDKLYPDEISKIKTMPILLYYKGTIKKNSIGFAVVGSRRATEYAKNITADVVEYLTEHNMTIISGMAKGIDSVAHSVCINNGGYTIAFLANGLDICYPKEHKKLYESIIKNGAIISKYPIGTKPYRMNFIARNFLIASWSKAIFISQASKNSGALATAEFTIKQKKKVFVLPDRVNLRESEGSNNLILNGGTIFISKEQFDLDTEDENTEKIKVQEKLSFEEYEILKILKKGAVNNEELKLLFKKDIDELLFKMEMDGRIRSYGGIWHSLDIRTF